MSNFKDQWKEHIMQLNRLKWSLNPQQQKQVDKNMSELIKIVESVDK